MTLLHHIVLMGPFSNVPIVHALLCYFTTILVPYVMSRLLGDGGDDKKKDHGDGVTCLEGVSTEYYVVQTLFSPTP